MGADSTSAETFLVLAIQRLAAGDPDGAERVVRQGLEECPEAHGFHLKLGEIEAARGAEIEAYYEYQWELLRAGDQRPTGNEAAVRSARLLDKAGAPEIQQVTKALQYLAAQEPHEALRALEAVYTHRGDRFALRMFRASARHAAGRLEAAEADYRALLERDEFFVPAYIELAKVLRATARPEEAAALERRARDIDPMHWSLTGGQP